MNAAGAIPRGRDAPEPELLDVRGMAPPGPMVAILSRIASGAAGPFVVRLDRDPVFLYPELAERGWAATRVDGDPGEVRLRLEPLR